MPSRLRQESNVFCPLCERETDVPLAEVQSPTIPPFMPTDFVLGGILRSRGHVCRQADIQTRGPEGVPCAVSKRVHREIYHGAHSERKV